MTYRFREHGAAAAHRCFDARTGQLIPAVVEYDTVSHRVVRWDVDWRGRVRHVEGTDSVACVTEVRELRVEWLEDDA